MEKVLPIVIICSVGIVLCAAYLIFVCVRVLRKKTRSKRNEFEIEDDVLTIKLGKKKK